MVAKRDKNQATIKDDWHGYLYIQAVVMSTSATCIRVCRIINARVNVWTKAAPALASLNPQWAFIGRPKANVAVYKECLAGSGDPMQTDTFAKLRQYIHRLTKLHNSQGELDEDAKYELEYYLACLQKNKFCNPKGFSSTLLSHLDRLLEYFMADKINNGVTTPRMVLNQLVPQLYNLSSLLEDFSVCTYDEGNFVYPPTLALDRVSIDSERPTDLYLLSYRSKLYFYMPSADPDPTILKWLLGPNYANLREIDDIDAILDYEGVDACSPSSYVGRLSNMVEVERESSSVKGQTVLIIGKHHKIQQLLSIIDEFSFY